MPGNIRTTYPTWHQPWACHGCQKHGEVIFRVTNAKQEWLRAMVRQIDADHRAASPVCPYDISSKPKGRVPPMVIGRPYRRNPSGQRIHAQGPTETDEEFRAKVRRDVWPPWLEQQH